MRNARITLQCRIHGTNGSKALLVVRDGPVVLQQLRLELGFAPQVRRFHVERGSVVGLCAGPVSTSPHGGSRLPPRRDWSESLMRASASETDDGRTPTTHLRRTSWATTLLPASRYPSICPRSLTPASVRSVSPAHVARHRHIRVVQWRGEFDQRRRIGKVGREVDLCSGSGC
jgi:hypothetical protein